MTKADVLDGFENLQVCTAYKVNGKELREIPFQMSRLKIQPVYKNFMGWNKPTSRAKVVEELPEKMKNYIEFINHYLGINIQYVSNGPARDQIVIIA